MDFITGFLAVGERKATNCLVVTDRLTKSVILIGIDLITANALAKAFLVHIYIHHGLLTAIISDRGTQFVSDF
jgi:IS30 family transposase